MKLQQKRSGRYREVANRKLFRISVRDGSVEVGGPEDRPSETQEPYVLERKENSATERVEGVSV